MERQVTPERPTTRLGNGVPASGRRPRRGFGRWLPENRIESEDLLSAHAWMVGITVALFLAPGINGLIAGMVGGGRLGDPRRAGAMALVAAVLASVGLWLVLGPLRMPILGLYPGVGTGEAVLLSAAGLLLGAALSGALARARAFHGRRGPA